jgi:outer membrane protein assembly factor BamB
LVVDHKVIVPRGGVGKIVSLLAMDADTGTTIWESGNHQVSYASPVLATLHGRRQVLSVNEDFVTAHDLESGQILWEHAWPGRSHMNANCSQPVPLDGDRVFLSKGYNQGAELLEIGPGPSWQVRSLWKARVLKTKFSNVAIRDGCVFGLDDGILSCLDLESGQRRWKKGRYGYGQNLLVGDLLLMVAENGDLALVAADPERFVELARLPGLTGQTWNNPALFGNLLLIRNAEEAACYQLKLR